VTQEMTAAQAFTWDGPLDIEEYMARLDPPKPAGGPVTGKITQMESAAEDFATRLSKQSREAWEAKHGQMPDAPEVSDLLDKVDHALDGYLDPDQSTRNAARAAVGAVADWLVQGRFLTDAEGNRTPVACVADLLRAEVAKPPAKEDLVAEWLKQVASLTADDSPYTVAAREALLQFLVKGTPEWPAKVTLQPGSVFLAGENGESGRWRTNAPVTLIWDGTP
jgi:hypothetical protein